ncbi:DNA methyltransferase 1-associated 1 [Babesia ovis]|uniref:DNA methyltransferase 1-associated 1 n=1 Tax=Babesia ovis TaxID=5869 RepID=A0A9W5WVG9_BABOV|nr:DNA methyltransferase 1-associated 1 [Babesia ovis]
MRRKDTSATATEIASLPTSHKLTIKTAVEDDTTANEKSGATAGASGTTTETSEKAPVKVWRMCPFRNPARSDGLVLKHWRKVTRDVEPNKVNINDPIELKEKYINTLESNATSALPRVEDETTVVDTYPFAKIAPAVKIYRYSDEFYRFQLCDLDPSWTKEETDLLFDLCEMFELRFVAIHDRFKWRKDISLEKLKHRYYSVTKRIIEFSFEEKIKTEMAKHNNPTHPVIVALRDEAARHPLIKFTYNMEHDRDRREMLERSYRVTEEQKRLEEQLLEEIKEAEALVKKEERKKNDLKKLKKKFNVVEDIITIPTMEKLHSKNVWLASEIVSNYKAQMNQKHNEAVDEMLAALNIPTPVISSRASNELYCVVRGDAAIMINLVNKVDSLKKELEHWKAQAGPLPDHMVTPKTKGKAVLPREAPDATAVFQAARADGVMVQSVGGTPQQNSGHATPQQGTPIQGPAQQGSSGTPQQGTPIQGPTQQGSGGTPQQGTPIQGPVQQGSGSTPQKENGLSSSEMQKIEQEQQAHKAFFQQNVTRQQMMMAQQQMQQFGQKQQKIGQQHVGQPQHLQSPQQHVQHQQSPQQHVQHQQSPQQHVQHPPSPQQHVQQGHSQHPLAPPQHQQGVAAKHMQHQQAVTAKHPHGPPQHQQGVAAKHMQHQQGHPQHMQSPRQQPQQVQQQGRPQMQQVYPIKVSPGGNSSPHVYPQQPHYQIVQHQPAHMGQQSPMAKQPGMPQMGQHGMQHPIMQQQRMMQPRVIQYAPYSQQQYQPVAMRMHPQGIYFTGPMYQTGHQPHYGHIVQHPMQHQQGVIHQMGQPGHMQPQQMGQQGQMGAQMKSPMQGHMTMQMPGHMGGQIQGQPGGGQSQQMGPHPGRGM